MTKYFNEEEIAALSVNPYVKKVSRTTITYTQEFRELFVAEYEKGKMPSQILRENGFDPKVFGKERIHSMSRNFRNMAKREAGMADTRKGASGRKRAQDRETTPEDEISRLKHRIKYLEQENEFLKKIEFLDRQAEYKARRKYLPEKNSN